VKGEARGAISLPPTLRKKSREGWGTHCVVCRRKAGPPAFNTCITVEGVPTSGSLSSKWMCSGITTYPTTTKR
jgi:hypothetical protein